MNIALIVQLLSGVLGGNLIGLISRKISLGFLGNSLLGIIGAFLAFEFSFMDRLGLDFGEMGVYLGEYDLGELIGRASGGILGGAIFSSVFGLVKGLLVKEE